jgi:hypothetical protein
MTAKYMIDTAVGEYVTYWNAVIGQDAEHAVRAFDLVPGDMRGFEEWVGEAQAEAFRQGFDADDLVDIGWCARRAARDLKDAADAIATTDADPVCESCGAAGTGPDCVDVAGAMLCSACRVAEEPADHTCTNCGAEPDAGCNCHTGRFIP